jgi:hypothetical protein
MANEVEMRQMGCLKPIDEPGIEVVFLDHRFCLKIQYGGSFMRPLVPCVFKPSPGSSDGAGQLFCDSR